MIDAQTELYGVIGNPVHHSLSPLIHNRAFRRLGWNAVYLAFEVKDIEEAFSGQPSALSKKRTKRSLAER